MPLEASWWAGGQVVTGSNPVSLTLETNSELVFYEIGRWLFCSIEPVIVTTLPCIRARPALA